MPAPIFPWISSISSTRSRSTRSKGLNEEACKSLILQMLSETGPASRAKIVALLDDLLPAGLSDQQKSKRVSNLLTKMKNVDRTVDNDGVVGKAARWRAI